MGRLNDEKQTVEAFGVGGYDYGLMYVCIHGQEAFLRVGVVAPTCFSNPWRLELYRDLCFRRRDIEYTGLAYVQSGDARWWFRRRTLLNICIENVVHIHINQFRPLIT